MSTIPRTNEEPTRGRLVSIGLLSHFCAASFPFLAKASITSLGAYRGPLIIYIVAVGLIWITCLSTGKTREVVARIRKALADRRLLTVFIAMMVLATISVGLFYVGLGQSNPGDFTLVVRLEHLMALILGLVLLGERGRPINIVGGIIGFAGWLLVVNFGSVQGLALLFAIGYIVTSGAATLLAKVMLRSLDSGAFFALRMTASMLTLVAMTALSEEKSVQFDTVGLAIVLSTVGGGIVLSLLFFGRYYAMERLPLWLYSSLSATQMVFTPLFSWMLGKPLGWQVILGGCIVTVGVTLAALRIGDRQSSPQSSS